MRYVVDTMNEDWIEATCPLVITTTSTRFHPGKAMLYTVVNGTPVTDFKVKILDLASRQSTPVSSIKDPITNNVKGASKDVLSLQFLAG